MDLKAVWGTKNVIFDKNLSHVQNIIISNGRFALTAMLDKIEMLYECLRLDPICHNAFINPAIPDIISEIMFYQGLASTFLFDKTISQSASTWKKRSKEERFSYIENALKTTGAKITVLANRDLRNKIVHFDEHLLQAVRENPNAGVFYDAALMFRDEFSNLNVETVLFCRTFIGAEEKILHLGEEISIHELWSEANSILVNVFGNPPRENKLQLLDVHLDYIEHHPLGRKLFPQE